MKKFKNLSLIVVTTIVILNFLFAPFSNLFKKTVYAEQNITIINDDLLNYISISSNGQVFTTDNIKTIDTNGDNVIDTSLVYVAETATLTLNTFQYNYLINFENENYFYKQETTIVLEKNTTTGLFPTSFTVNNKTFSYNINTESNAMYIYSESNNKNIIARTDQGNLVSYVDTSDTRTIKFINSYTLKYDAPNTYVQLDIFVNGSKINNYYTINFERPISDFKTNDVTMFTCNGVDVSTFVNPKIERELSYETVNLKFTNNDYTENNPLYFDINHNGFVYNFKLYSKTLESKDLLFVEYFDEQKPINNKSLATKINSNNGTIDKYVYKYTGEPAEFNTFSIDFTKTGRYEISVYDSTYQLGLSNNNYYSTSFYIKNSSNTAFDNTYAILQSFDDNNNILDYIVSTSTQNNNVRITVKNLLYYFENDDVLNSFVPDETNEDLVIVEFKKTTLSGSLNIPESTYYTLGQLKETLTNKNPDLTIDCSDDAFFELVIYKYNTPTLGENSTKVYQSIEDDNIQKTEYNFTIVKKPKISYTYFLVDEDNDRIPDTKDPEKYLTDIYIANIPFEIETKEYKININSNMELSTKFKNSTISNLTLDKTYLNNYTIDYAMQSVLIQVPKLSDNDENKNKFNLQFYGVGNISVEITVNSVTTQYTVQSGEILSFTEYGSYSVTITDEMGTIGAGVFNNPKPTSISAILLIVFAGIIVLAVVLFIISSRGKVATR